MKLQLPTVQLTIIDCLEVEKSLKVLEKCQEKIDFGAVKFLSNIPNDSPYWVEIKPLKSLVAYSIFMLTKFHEYIDLPMVQIVQRDGFIINAESWNDDWLGVDFLGGLYMQMDRVGSGGFSLRSKKIMRDVSKTLPDWDWSQEHAEEIQKRLSFYEDGELSLTAFAKNYKIATNEQGAAYSQAGNRNPKYFRKRPYGFHRTFQEIQFDTGLVDSSDTTRDIRPTYDDIISTF